MAYINVAEWSPDQVTDWLKGKIDVSSFHKFFIRYYLRQVKS